MARGDGLFLALRARAAAWHVSPKNESTRSYTVERHFFRMKWPSLIIVLGLALVLPGCESVKNQVFGGQQHIAGEPLLYGIDRATGKVIDSDLWPLRAALFDKKAPDSILMVPETAFSKGDIIRVVLDTVYIRRLEDFGNPHVLVFAEVNDDGTDNPDSSYVTILYNERNQAPKVAIPVTSKTIYGPLPFRGYPIRIRLHVVELDKENKENASRLLDAAAGIATASAPEIAPVIGIAVKLGQAINALDEDDFELRFDMSFAPSAVPIGQFKQSLTPPSYELPTEERSSTQNMPETNIVRRWLPAYDHYSKRPLAETLALRTGQYVVIKRETRERGRALVDALSEPKHCDDAGTLEFDYPAPHISTQYKSQLNSDNFDVNAGEVLTYEAGRLRWRVVTPESKTFTVYPTCGVNKDRATDIFPGDRTEFRDRTYAVIQFENHGGDGEAASLDAVKARATRERKAVGDLLIDPSKTLQQVVDRLNDVGVVVKGMQEIDRLAANAARRAANEPTFRGSADYPAYWVVQIEEKKLPADDKAPDTWTVAERNAVARNAAILDVVESIVLGMPVLDPANRAHMTCLKDLKADSFKPSNVPGGATSGTGRFTLSSPWKCA